MSENKYVKFQIKIPNSCWENSEKTLGGYYFAAPCNLDLKLLTLLLTVTDSADSAIRQTTGIP